MDTFLPTSTDPLLDVVVPAAPLPDDLAGQRQWAELRKLQIDTERAALELESFRRRENEEEAEAG